MHPALLAAEQPRRVLIIGGGEGATLREVLRDGRIEHVTMVDIDKGLVELCQQHLPMMHQGSFYSPKVTLVFEDSLTATVSACPALPRIASRFAWPCMDRWPRNVLQNAL